MTLKMMLPPIILAICSLVLVVDYYVPSGVGTLAVDQLTTWSVVVMGFMLMYGSISIVPLHARRISERKPGQWPFSALLLGVIFSFIIVGCGLGPSSNAFGWGFNNIMLPSASAIFSLMCFYTVCACYRVFKAKTWEATMMMVVAIVIMLTSAPVGGVISPYIPNFGNWILTVPNGAAQKTLIIGTSLGAAALSIRLILGREKGYVTRGS